LYLPDGEADGDGVVDEPLGQRVEAGLEVEVGEVVADARALELARLEPEAAERVVDRHLEVFVDLRLGDVPALEEHAAGLAGEGLFLGKRRDEQRGVGLRVGGSRAEQGQRGDREQAAERGARGVIRDHGARG
jgi:hypothetical protein